MKYEIVRKAALEMSTLDNKEVVKIAGVLSRLKKWWDNVFSVTDKENILELKEKSVKLNIYLDQLQADNEAMMKAVRDGDVNKYNRLVNSIRDNIVYLAKYLKELNATTEEAAETLERSETKEEALTPVSDENSKEEQPGAPESAEHAEPAQPQLEPQAEAISDAESGVTSVDAFPPNFTPESSKAPAQAPQDLSKEEVSRLYYTREDLRDKNKRLQLLEEARRQLKKHKPNHDVDFGKHDKPMQEFNWFKSMTPDQVKFNNDNPSASLPSLVRSIYQAFIKSGRDSSVLDNIFKNSEKEKEFENNLKQSIVTGTLKEYNLNKVIKNKNKRDINENKIIIETAEFSLPGTSYRLKLLGELTDMAASRKDKNYISFGHVKKVTIIGGDAQSSSEAKAKFRMRLLEKYAGVDREAAKNLGDSFWVKFVQMAHRLGARPEDLAKVINSESYFDPKATNVQNGRIIAKGLNQLIKKTALHLGMTEDQWQNYEYMPAEDQLYFVEKFFRMVGRNRGPERPWDSATQLYVANFAPKYINQAANPKTVLYSKYRPDGSLNPEYTQNKGLDRDGKEHITAGDMARSVQGPLPKHVQEGLKKAEMIISGKAPMPETTDSDSDTPNTSEADELLQILLSERGPIENLVKRAVYTNYLPTTHVSVICKSPGNNKFFKLLKASLANVLGESSEINVLGKFAKLTVAIPGSSYAVCNAVKSLADCCKFAMELKNKEIEYYILPVGDL